MATSQPGNSPSSPSPQEQGGPPPADQLRQTISRNRRDEPEQELWQGSYSARSMIDAWGICALITLAALIAAALFLRDPLSWTAVVVGLIVVWAIPVFTLLYRRLAIAYRLTSQRFFIERGILKRTIDRTELIRIDDLAYEQRLLERMITGTGTIRITSSDPSQPQLYLRGIENVREVFAQLDAARRTEKTRHGIQINSV